MSLSQWPKFWGPAQTGHIHNLRIFREPDETVLAGTGSLVVDDEQQLVIDICAPALNDEDPRLISSENPFALHFEGDFVGTPIRQPYRVRGRLCGSTRGHCSAANNRWWKQRVERIEFNFNGPNVGQYMFQGLVHLWPNFALTLRQTMVRDEDDLFGEIVTYYQKWTLEHSNCRIGIRDNAIHKVGELIIKGSEAESEQLQQIAEALLKALSLRWGYEIELLSSSFERGSDESYTLFPHVLNRRENHSDLMAPIVPGPYQDGTNERFMKLATSYFMNADDINLYKYMTEFWRTGPTGSITLRESVLGPAIEGVAQQIIEKKASPERKEEIRQLRNSVKECKRKMLAALDSQEDLQQNPHFAPLRAALENHNQVARKTISIASEILKFHISDEELRAWFDMRNASAHGRSAHAEIDDERMKNYHTSVTLLNKFCLALIGYEGVFWNYADPDRVSTFTLVES